MPTLRLPDFGSRVTTQGSVMYRPPSPGQVCSTGNFSTSTASPFRMTSLHGARFASMRFGKNEPISASLGSSFSLSINPFGGTG